jgi:hypothetical protein
MAGPRLLRKRVINNRHMPLVQLPIESFCFLLNVVQLPFSTLTSLFRQKCNLLKARVVIYACLQVRNGKGWF